jgi:hypothetical protein
MTTSHFAFPARFGVPVGNDVGDVEVLVEEERRLEVRVPSVTTSTFARRSGSSA